MKTHTTVSDIKRSLCGRDFVIGSAGMALVIMLSSLESIIVLIRNGSALPYGFHIQMLVEALSGDPVMLTLPILCAIPFTAAFVDDVKSGFIKQCLHRVGKTEYVKGKLIACGLSGGMVMVIGIALAYGIFFIAFLAMEIAPKPGETILPCFMELLQKATLTSLSGVFWSLTGFTFAAMTMNKYMAYASPFIIYYALIIFNERYYNDLYVLYPKEWLSPSENWIIGDGGVILLLATLSAGACVGFAVVARRRLAHV